MNKKIVIYILVILVIIFGAYYFFTLTKQNQQNPEQMPTSQMSNTQTNTQSQIPDTQLSSSSSGGNAESSKTYSVSIINFAFNPASLSINKGDTVVWTNNDSVPHQVRGDNLRDFSAPIMNNGATYSYTFNNIGTFNYRCAIHPSMIGSIIVK